MIKRFTCCLCGIEFENYECNQRKKRNFCSTTCYFKSKKKELPKCLVCGHTVKKHRNKCCSNRCSQVRKLQQPKYRLAISKTSFNVGHTPYLKKHTEEAKLKMSLARRGDKNWNWLGGISIQYIKKYSSRRWGKIKRLVYARDNYTCQKCSSKKNILHAHHITPYRISKDDSLENLITLCPSCHIREEYKIKHIGIL